jgi:hypothetical protein
MKKKKVVDCLNNGNCQSKSNLEPVAYRACLNLDNDDNKTIVENARVVKMKKKKVVDCLNNGNCQSKSNLEPVAYRACLNLDNDELLTIGRVQKNVLLFFIKIRKKKEIDNF